MLTLRTEQGHLPGLGQPRGLKPFKTEGAKPPEQSHWQTFAGDSSKIWVCEGAAWDAMLSHRNTIIPLHWNTGIWAHHCLNVQWVLWVNLPCDRKRWGGKWEREKKKKEKINCVSAAHSEAALEKSGASANPFTSTHPPALRTSWGTLSHLSPEPSSNLSTYSSFWFRQLLKNTSEEAFCMNTEPAALWKKNTWWWHFTPG